MKMTLSDLASQMGKKLEFIIQEKKGVEVNLVDEDDDEELNLERKSSYIVVRSSGVKMDDGLYRFGGRADHLVTNAVAEKADTPAAAAASKHG
ncbi:hypothetical protein R6Q57_014705 [Mikania cordata]